MQTLAALMYSKDDMNIKALTISFYFKMNPSGILGIYYDFAIQILQVFVLILWPLNLILAPLRWSLQLIQLISQFMMAKILQLSGLPVEYSEITINLEPYKKVATFVNKINVFRYISILLVKIWGNSFKDKYPLDHIPFITVFKALSEVPVVALISITVYIIVQ
jgi:hypothetical protein